jgi:copper homeostasis protein
MPGSGVRSNNIKQLAEYTGVTELHSSARKLVASNMQFTCTSMQETLENIEVDEEEIRKMKSGINA